ncbi:non-ribosomal peptide synthetase [Actinomyces sp. ZJ308]|uniref:non-ribosomal peptide synthetase n=1 Tax=Actinomyces sp. ZJ308 TaxID=2708342 RepID=UPI001422DBBA|nr:non-ribosomal peptide synthetase [Actinomyces sp. ZJ308]
MLTKDEIREQLLTALSTIIGPEAVLKDTDNLLALGLESLPTMRLLAGWIKRGYRVSFGSFMRRPTVAQWADMLFDAAPTSPADPNDPSAPSSTGALSEPSGARTDPASQDAPTRGRDAEPFDMTDVQYAYWIGRGRRQQLGGVGCHGYVEIKAGSLDVSRLEASWETVLRAHPMLRACYTSDGKQYVLPEPREAAVTVHDLSGLDEPARQAALLELRDNLSHRLLDIDNGQVCCLQVSLLEQGRAIIHFDIDLLVCDVQSFQIILRDLAHHYLTGEPPRVDPAWSFAAYIEDRARSDADDVEHDRRYWRSRLQELTGAPRLPMRQSPEMVVDPRFTRRRHTFDRQSWQDLRTLCENHATTPAMVLLTAYARTIAAWSEDRRFLISVPLFNRDSDPAIENVVADFTTLTLTQVDHSRRRRFADDLRAIQDSFYEDVSHSAYSAVKVLRDLRTQRGEQVLAPVVFSCNLGSPLVDEEFVEAFGEIGYMISQTPQVWIDMQVFNTIDGFTLIWDAVEQIFPTGLLDEMFDRLVREVERVISAGLDLTDAVESRSVAERRRALADVAQWRPPRTTLVERVFSTAARLPDAPAISTCDGQVTTYRDLADRARAVARSLMVAGAGPGDLAAVALPRGPQQIIAALGVMTAGMAYVPISPNQPRQRVASILASPRVRFVLTDGASPEQWRRAGVVAIPVDEALRCRAEIGLPDVRPQDSAYVIYTSGTTGAPKGVEISHGAVWNTIEAVSRRIGLGPGDAVLGVSAFDFDLSVYDAFGVLSAGGTLVTIPERARRDADFWLKAVQSHRITVWNSVPTLFEMLLASAGADPLALAGLRHVLLSGDWIDLTVPARMKTLAPGCRLLAMGGATEAAIWSNALDVEDVPDDWASIPYGRALDRQMYRVVDDAGRDCPDYVVGELWIGGLGVAEGYVDDPRLTAEKFVAHEGARWYRTGDLGRFWNDGTLEFLGRSDTQVKLRGHRIELGEIEAACETLLGAQRAVCILHGGPASQRLVAFVQIGPEPAPQRVRPEPVQVEAADVLAPLLLDETTRQAVARDEALQDAYALETMRQWLRRLADRRAATGPDDAPSRLDVLSRRWEQWLAQDTGTAVPPTAAELADLERFTAAFYRAFIDGVDDEAPPSAAELVQSSDFVPVEEFVSDRPVGRLAHRAIRDLLREISIKSAGGLRILEIGARRLSQTEDYRRAAEPRAYVIADYSRYYLDRVEQFAAGRFEQMLLHHQDGPVSGAAASSRAHQVDVVICNQTLHQSTDIDATLRQVRELLAPQGLLILVEPTASSPLADITAAFLSPEYRDARRGSGDMLLTAEGWDTALDRAGYTRISKVPLTDSLVLVVASRNGEDPATPLPRQDYEQAIASLSTRLPDYMLPRTIMRLSRLPLTPNGKVDRKALADLVRPEPSGDDRSTPTAPVTETESGLIDIWNALLEADARTDSDYFRLGGDSLTATRLRRRIEERFEIEFSLDTVFEVPVLGDMAARIDELAAQARPRSELPPIVHGEDQYAPFPLTDVQQSYLIGGSGAIELGEVSSHCYLEMDAPVLDPERLEDSWNALIHRHPMLRAVVCDDGLTQRFLREVPRYRIAEVPQEGLTGVRGEMSRQRFDPRRWPCFDVRYAKVGSTAVRLFLSFDNTFIDGWSMFQVLSEWKELYEQAGSRSTAAAPPAYSFKDYVEAALRLRDSDVYRRDLQYWEQLLEQIHPAPQLPVLPGGAASEFVRHHALIEAPVWRAAQERMRAEGLTEAAFLAEVYAEMLALYSQSPALSINLTQFDRVRFAPEVDSIVGDFTNLSILSVDTRSARSFRDRARALQQRMWGGLEHGHVSGVTVERMLNRQRRSRITMPVVFTCGLGVVEHSPQEDGPYLGTIGYGLSQTPQVWMDLQVYDDDGGLVLNLDAVEGLFPDAMVAEMFQSLTQAVRTLATTPSTWGDAEDERVTVCPTFNAEAIAELNATEVLEDDGLDQRCTDPALLGLFLNSLRADGDRPAVIDPRRTVTYAELDAESDEWARLIAATTPADGVVAILMEKSAYQVSAVLGVLKAGCTYLPLSTSQPPARNSRIIADAGARIVLSDDDRVPEDIARRCRVITVTDVRGGGRAGTDLEEKSEAGAADPFGVVASGPRACDCEGPAYIIYTSGTTGTPKGVAIAHRSAVNTIRDVNRRLAAGPRDRILALSQLNFDLSVYDIFGMLACGGAIIMPSPEEQREPSHWWDLVQRHRVTLWNSVPSLFTMYTSHLTDNGFTDTSTRAALLSGDWIPVDVALRIERCFRDCRAYGLGGATEASIWSNWYEIDAEDAGRPSIPYGRPLANQRMYVLSSSLENRPDLVPGDLYIAGRGLALGYWNDPERTEQSFIRHPVTGERLYRTGDHAMYGRDGNIVFLGRSDGQIKVNGYRIELGEIESVARSTPGVRDCVATAAHGISLYAVVDDDLGESSIRHHLEEHLPDYMLPRRIIVRSEIPRTWNGKIDRDRLDSERTEQHRAPAEPRHERDRRLIVIWMKVLNTEGIGIDDDFFQLGGDSLAAVHLVNSVKREMSVEISIQDVFTAPTIRSLAERIEKSVGGDVDEGEL